MVLIIYPFSIFFRFRSKTDFLKFTPFVSAIHLAKFGRCQFVIVLHVSFYQPRKFTPAAMAIYLR